MTRAASTLFLVFVLGLAAFPAMAQDDLYAALGGGAHIGLMRHATAPGSDDPPGFRLGDCSTQRNLSPGGRELAAEIGRRLRAAGVTSARLVSSQWCRCLDTAGLLDFGSAEEVPFFNSLVSYPRESGAMTRDAREWILAQPLNVPTIVVTHQINIDALVGTSPAEGEIVVVRRSTDGRLEVIGTIGAD